MVFYFVLVVLFTLVRVKGSFHKVCISSFAVVYSIILTNEDEETDENYCEYIIKERESDRRASVTMKTANNKGCKLNVIN